MAPPLVQPSVLLSRFEDQLRSKLMEEAMPPRLVELARTPRSRTPSPRLSQDSQASRSASDDHGAGVSATTPMLAEHIGLAAAGVGLDEDSVRVGPPAYIRDDYRSLAGVYESFKLYGLGLVLIPVKMVLYIAIWLLFGVIGGLSRLLIGAPSYDDNGTIIGVRPIQVTLLRWTTIVCARLAMLICGMYWPSITDLRTPEERKARVPIVVSNHTGFLDLFLCSYLFQTSYLAKAEVRSIPVVGWATESGNFPLFTHRNGKGGGVSQQLRTRVNAYAEGATLPPLTVFPEGTTTNGRYIAKFKTGAFLSGQPVQPMVIRYRYKHFNPYDSALRRKDLEHMCRVFTQFSNHAEVTILPPYYPTNEEKENPRLYADNVNKAMAKALQVPISEYTYADKKRYLDFLHNKVDPDEYEASWNIRTH